MASLHGRTIGRTIGPVVLAVAIAAAGIPHAAAQRRAENLEWTAYRDARLGFTISYPASVFAPEDGDPTEALGKRTEKRSGRVFRSRDGKAYLQAAAFENTERIGPANYKARIVGTSYRGARITYDRLGDVYFVLSGIRGAEEFYERVTFTCSGRLINVWTITYPSAERLLYDRIVEEVARTFRPADSRESCE